MPETEAVREIRVICRINERQAGVLDGLALVRGTTRSDVLRRLIDRAGREVLAEEKESAVPALRAGGASF